MTNFRQSPFIFCVVISVGCMDYSINDPNLSNKGISIQEDAPVAPDSGTPDDTGQHADTAIVAAEASVYGNTSEVLYELVLSTGEVAKVGEFHDGSGAQIAYFVDIAIDLSGRMVGGTFDGLYQIDPATAQVQLLCMTDVDMRALTFTAGGALVAGGVDEINVIDVDTCTTTPLLESSYFETSGDLVGLPDGYLYWTVRGEEGDELVKLDPNTGMSAWVGVIGFEGLYGLGYHDGELFGLSADGYITSIDPSSAAAQVWSYDQDLEWWGGTTNPVVW